MTSVGYATLDVIPSVKGMRAELDRQIGGDLTSAGRDAGTKFGDVAGKSAGSRFGSVFKTAAKAGLVGLAGLGAGAVKIGMDSISLASDLEESTNKVSQVFGKAADDVFRFSERTADALGQTNQQARDAAATFGLFGNMAGLSDKKSAKFSIRMTRLASDLASFHNTEPDQAVQALGAALRGESEPIRAFGVLLDEATLKAEALSLGLLKPVKDEAKIKGYQVAILEGQQKYNDAVGEYGKKSLEALKAEANLGTARDRLAKATEGTIPPLTQQQKVLAAQSAIFKQTEVAQGDFARTSDGLANQQRRLSARFEDAKAKLGKGLLPIMTDAADFLLTKGIPAFERFSDWFNDTGLPALKKFGDRAQTVGGFVGDLVADLRDLPSPAKYAGLAALLGGGAALKVRGGGGGALGGAGRALGLAKPVNVFVTNPGFGAGGGLGADGSGKRGGWAAGGRSFAAAAGPALALYMIPVLDKELKGNPVTDNADEWGRKTNEFFVGLKDAFTSTRDMGAAPDAFKRLPTMDINGNDLDAVRSVVLERKLEGLQSQAGKFGETLDLIGNKKVDPSLTIRGMEKGKRDLQAFLAQQVEARKPITPYVALTGYDRVMSQLANMEARIHALPTAGIDNGVPFASGGGTSTGGVNFNGPINVQAHDYNDFVRQTQRKTQQAGLGGRPR